MRASMRAKRRPAPSLVPSYLEDEPSLTEMSVEFRSQLSLGKLHLECCARNLTAGFHAEQSCF